MQASKVPVIEEQKQPLNSRGNIGMNQVSPMKFIRQNQGHAISGEQGRYALEDNKTGVPFSSDDSEIPTKLTPLIEQNNGQGRRHASMKMDRNDAFTEEIQI